MNPIDGGQPALKEEVPYGLVGCQGGFFDEGVRKDLLHIHDALHFTLFIEQELLLPGVDAQRPLGVAQLLLNASPGGETLDG